MMQTSPYPTQPGMGPGHPGMAHGHHMQVQHGHMGQPNHAMMGAIHPMTGPQVTQAGPMASMPPNPGAPAPGGPMGNAMAMAHLGSQAPMFPSGHPPMNMGQMQQMNASMMARQRAMNMMQAQNNQLGGHGMMNMQNMHGLNPAQMQQMKMNMPLQQQQMQHMSPQQQNMLQQQHQLAHQQRMMVQHHAQQNQLLAQQRQQQAAAQQQHASQQMQLSRSQQEPTTQPPQPQPTPAPPAQPQPQAQAQPNAPSQQPTPQQKPQPPPPTTQPPPQSAPTPQIKQAEEEESQTKPDIKPPPMMMELPISNQDFNGQCILQLLSYYDTLASPGNALDVGFWKEQIARYYSEQGSIRQQIVNIKHGSDKSFQLRYEALPRFYHSHFKNGVKKIFMQSFDHVQEPLANGGTHVSSNKLYVTYEYNDGIRITMNGQLKVNFDDMQKITQLSLITKGWTEYVPRPLADIMQSPEMTRESPKLTKKNLPKNLQRQPKLPRSPVNEWGIPNALMQFFEIAEVLNVMGPLMAYCDVHQLPGPREALQRYNAENAAMALSRQQNANATVVNGQVYATPRMAAGMNPPNQFHSPALAHLHLPQNQQSPHMNHTPSPGHGQGGVQMVHQMSAQGSNLSSSQGPSTNTSPNVTNKRRRASAIKEEDAAQATGGDKTKPSPRVGKRQKGAPA